MNSEITQYNDNTPTPMVHGYRAYGIYANYDSIIPNTEILIIAASKDLAEHLASLLNSREFKYEGHKYAENLCYAEGYELFKTYMITKIITQDTNYVVYSIGEAITFLHTKNMLTTLWRPTIV